MWALSRGGAQLRWVLHGNPCLARLARDPHPGLGELAGASRVRSEQHLADPAEGLCAGPAGRDGAEVGQLLSLPSSSSSSCQDSRGVSGQQQTRGGSLHFCCLQLKLEHDCLGQLFRLLN